MKSPKHNPYNHKLFTLPKASFYRQSLHVLLAIILANLVSVALAKPEGELVINSMHADGTAKKALAEVVELFKKENPSVKVTVNTIDHESFKIQIRTWLPNNPPDVATWFAGNRASFFVEKKLIEPIDDIWAEFGNEFTEGAKSSVTFRGKKYLLPTNYYHWGFFYRKDLFAKAGISKAPQNWGDFVNAVTKLKAAGLTPITLGTKQAWSAAAWFDFLNMRLNGFDFHMALLAGNEKYTDPRVEKTMALWAELLKLQAFPKNAAAMTWQEASALLWQGKAAMYLMGNFMSSEIPADIKDKVEFFGFPQISANIPVAQVAPTDVYFIPSKAKNKENAKAFLKFLARADIQSTYNEIAQLIPPNKNAKIKSENRFVSQGIQLLSEAKNLSQFYDRDAEPEVAKVGMDGFIEFMNYPDRVASILKRIESTRQRVHKK